MYRLVVLSAAVALAVAGPLSANDKADGCVIWDDKITKQFIQPLQEQMKKSDSEFITVGDNVLGLLGFGVEWKNGKAGNFSTVQLNSPVGATASSKLCTVGNMKTLSVNLGFGDLEAGFDSLTIYTPFFNIGGSKTALSLIGENLELEVSAVTDPTTKKCTAQLGAFLFNKWGSLQLDLGDGLINMLLSKLFNLFVSSRIVGVLEVFDVGTKINGYAVQFLTPVMAKYGDLVCVALS